MATINDLPFSLSQLQEAVEDGLVTARPHDVYPYTIYNYSDVVQFSRAWNDVTLNCRGLILDHNGNIIARPWKKFFNLGETNLQIQFDDPVEVMDKVDGSLGILYPTPDGTYAISTRGSMHSEQAEHATELWKNKYASYLDATLHSADTSSWEFTYLFEIIFKENRIVLDYGDMDDLVLLGAVNRKTGYYYGPREAKAFLGWFGPVVEVMDFNTLSEANKNITRPNAEGYVVRSHNFMVKVKQPGYIELHRLRFNMTPKRIWEALSTGADLESIVAPLPDEFQDAILEIGEDFLEKYREIALVIARDSQELAEYKDDRKIFAQHASKKRHPGALFSVLDGKVEAVDAYIWKMIKPRGDE